MGAGKGVQARARERGDARLDLSLVLARGGGERAAVGELGEGGGGRCGGGRRRRRGTRAQGASRAGQRAVHGSRGPVAGRGEWRAKGDEGGGERRLSRVRESSLQAGRALHAARAQSQVGASWWPRSPWPGSLTRAGPVEGPYKAHRVLSHCVPTLAAEEHTLPRLPSQAAARELSRFHARAHRLKRALHPHALHPLPP